MAKNTIPQAGKPIVLSKQKQKATVKSATAKAAVPGSMANNPHKSRGKKGS
jgi:hypothetical protein